MCNAFPVHVFLCNQSNVETILKDKISPLELSFIRPSKQAEIESQQMQRTVLCICCG